jgi:hypothetical protein
MVSKLDAEIDRLYQLPLDEFTSARNALAKEAGGDAARVRALAKPSVAAWAVNQLYWQDRKAYDELIAAADEARRAHKAVLSGKSGDVRAAGKVHEDAVEHALERTLALLKKSGHPASDATRQAIATTLRALPGGTAPGRLTQALQPGGFEMLSGLAMARGKVAHLSRPAATQSEAHHRAAKQERQKPKVDAKALARARQEVAAAERELRSAEGAAKRAEFEKARAERDLKRAEEATAEARRELDSASSRAAHRDEELASARERLDAARAALQQVEQKSEA